MNLIFVAAFLLTHTLCHIIFLPCKTYADFAEGLLFSKASPAVKTHSFSDEISAVSMVSVKGRHQASSMEPSQLQTTGGGGQVRGSPCPCS